MWFYYYKSIRDFSIRLPFSSLIAPLRCVLVSQSKVMVARPRSGMSRKTLHAVGQLRLVRVILPGVYLQSGFDVFVPLVGPSHHPQDGLLQDVLRLPLQHVRRPPLLQSAGVASMPSVELVCTPPQKKAKSK